MQCLRGCLQHQLRPRTHQQDIELPPGGPQALMSLLLRLWIVLCAIPALADSLKSVSQGMLFALVLATPVRGQRAPSLRGVRLTSGCAPMMSKTWSSCADRNWADLIDRHGIFEKGCESIREPKWHLRDLKYPCSLILIILIRMIYGARIRAALCLRERERE